MSSLINFVIKTLHCKNKKKTFLITDNLLRKLWIKKRILIIAHSKWLP